MVALMLAAAGLAAAPVAEAAVFCMKRSGKVFVRDACKSNETTLNLADFGAVGPQGPQGLQGLPGAPGRSALTALQSGETLVGLWGGSISLANGEFFRVYSAFPIPLGASIPDGNQIFLDVGATTPECPGPGQAAPGFLCVYADYVDSGFNTPVNGNIFNPETGFGGASRYGWAMFVQSNGSGFFYSIHGRYAVTAP